MGTANQFEAKAAEVVRAIRDFVRRATRSLTERVDSIEQRLARLEDGRKAFTYRGVWNKDLEYGRNDFVTYNGGLWHCDRNTREEPGKGSPAWQLAVKPGRDAR